MARHRPLLLLQLLALAGGQRSSPGSGEQPLTERAPTEWLLPAAGPTEAVPVEWLRPVPIETLGREEDPAAAQADLLDGRNGPVQEKWTTPLDLYNKPVQPLSDGDDVPGSGRYRLPAAAQVTISSARYPGEYTNYIWNTWIIETASSDTPLTLVCPTWELGVGDYFTVEGSGGYRVTFMSTSETPQVKSKGVLNIQIQTDGAVGGRFRCVISASDSAGTTPSAPSPKPPPSPVTQSPSKPPPRPVTSPPVNPTKPSADGWVNEPDCGVTKYDTRIVGGKPAPRNSYPWLVGLAKTNKRKPFCAGSIINERYILTAAHCVQRQRPGTFNVLVRKHMLRFDPEEEVFSVSKIISHPNYSTSTQDKDLALLRLSSSLRSLLDNADYRVRPICLPSAPCRGSSCLAGSTAVLAGWGLLQQGSSNRPNTVQHVKVPIMSNKKCASFYSKAKIGISSNMVCAGFAEGGKDTCQGDSGGPMMVKNSNNVYTQEGIVSFGRGCAQAAYPGVYTRVSQFYNWIKENSRP